MDVAKPNNPPPNSPSVRVLTRPWPPPSSSSPSSSVSSQQSPPINGVVVVGFVGRRRPAITTHLINRILDSNIFGNNNLDKNLVFASSEKEEDWFRWRRISYFHEEKKGILFLHFSSVLCPGFHDGFGEAMEDEHEFGELQGLLFMFSVCHVIIHIQEGSRFDTQLLKKFRVLQAAKHALVPFVRSQATAGLPSRPHPSSSARPTTSAPTSNNSSPGRGRNILSRNASAISVMPGLGSYTSLFPGQCTPVMLFVFIDHFCDAPNPSSNVEESTDASPHNQSSSLSGLTRPNLPVKVSGPVVVLARPVSKSEGGFRKKLQSSLEAQVRFLVKKCRILSGSETSHGGSRSGGISSSVPLFSLDASRAVVLLDRSANQIGESLEFATELVEDVLNGKATSDSLLLESQAQNANKEDIISVKEFIYRQCDILRGKGALVSNSNGSAAGVGMVAAAAAAAAASASATSGKTFTTPELPNIDSWLSSCQQILNRILSAKGGCLEEVEISKRKPRPRNPQPLDGIASKNLDPQDVAVSWLEIGKGLNAKFSTLWCERTLPAAKEVYLKDLPVCYPTSQHKTHLEKALRAFHSMVKGPAVQNFAKKLEDECTAIWESGRQLCDAISLTGKPCKHQRHDLQSGEVVSGAGVKPHCSGYVFLHACACGRSRRLRLDPFDFESANISSNCFLDCDKLLPALQLPKVIGAGPIQSSSWSLIRVGSTMYYEPSKGLLQSGFSTTQKFLLKWEIFLEKQKSPNGLTAASAQQDSTNKLSADPKSEHKACTDKRTTATANVQFFSGEVHFGVENQRKPSENVISDDKKISFGKGLPNVTMRKPFSEVVAGSATGDSGFPPLQQRRQNSSRSDRTVKQCRTGDLSVEQTAINQGSQKSDGTFSASDALNGIDSNSFTNVDPYLHIGSNVVPVNQFSGEIKTNPSFKHVTAYVGFEHECPRGHRFLLNPEHLDEFGTSNQQLEETQIPSFVDTSDQRPTNPSKPSNSSRRGRVHQNSNRMNAITAEKERNLDKSKEQSHMSFGVTTLHDIVNDLQGNLDSIRIDDGGQAFSMLNKNLPIYMNCPHCRHSKNKKELQKAKFAGTVSQLQRIFLVTPPFPVVLATCPVIQFETSCLPPSIQEREQKLRFTLGCEVVLPPESFLTLKLPFVYGVEMEDKSLHPLKYFEHQPEATAWITKGTTLQVVTKSSAGQCGSYT